MKKTIKVVRGTVEGIGWVAIALIIVAIVTTFIESDPTMVFPDNQ